MTFEHDEAFSARIVLLTFKLTDEQLSFVVDVMWSQKTVDGYTSGGTVLAVGVPAALEAAEAKPELTPAHQRHFRYWRRAKTGQSAVRFVPGDLLCPATFDELLATICRVPRGLAGRQSTLVRGVMERLSAKPFDLPRTLPPWPDARPHPPPSAVRFATGAGRALACW